MKSYSIQLKKMGKSLLLTPFESFTIIYPVFFFMESFSSKINPILHRAVNQLKLYRVGSYVSMIRN